MKNERSLPGDDVTIICSNPTHSGRTQLKTIQMANTQGNWGPSREERVGMSVLRLLLFMG